MNAPRKEITIALAGNPNSGKTTIFNALTGARQHVANYPGVTVELTEGAATCGETQCKIVDLPGIYSLTARSTEEIVARNFLIEEHPDAVIAVIDSSNLERNLYLAVQFLELGAPLVLALNMWDLLETRGLRLDEKKLSNLLGVPVIPTVGSRGQGVEKLLLAAVERARAGAGADDDPAKDMRHRVGYGTEIEPHVELLTQKVAGHEKLRNRARWYAIKLLEGDPVTRDRVAHLCPDRAPALQAEADKLRRHIEEICDDDIATLAAERRYGFIAGVHAETVSRTSETRVSASEKIDRVVLNRWLGLPIFAVMMYLVFTLTFTLGEPLMGLLERLFELLALGVGAWWPEGSESLLRSLLVNGVIGGVGGVLVFLPNILLLFMAISFLEDSGYMARAAFIMDSLMHKIGLHGKSFIPMLIGFGCTVPAIMATRTLESRRDRFTTILVLPLVSCGARLPIYMLIIPAFFAEKTRAPMMWLIYMIGIILAIVGAKLLRATVFKGETVPFVMELPPYRLPTGRGVLIHMWERSWQFLKKAGTVILGISVILWAFSIWPAPPAAAVEALAAERAAMEAKADIDQDARQTALEEIGAREAELALRHSAVGRLGGLIAPVLRPLGFDWKVSTALIGAFAAKEVFVAQLGIVHALGEADAESASLRETLRANYTPLQGFAIMLFCLISMPCVATVAVTRRETGAWKWALLQVGGLTALAWIITFLVYQTGLWLG